ncbi:MAG TPA: hypothetical protein VEK08_26920 [Planctomycetota bacterium]|nr:hypothetical protein [Planctomycetota bacterium]
MNQREVARVAGKKQSRISEIECGHLPRVKHWPIYLHAYQLQDFEAEFYRMVMTARADAIAAKAMQTKRDETPLLDPAQNPCIAEAISAGRMQGLQAAIYDQAPLIGQHEQAQRKAVGG